MLQQKYDTRVTSKLQLRSETTRGDSKKLLRARCHTQLHQNMCQFRVMDVWNSRPSSVIEAGTIQTFERRLGKPGFDIKFGREPCPNWKPWPKVRGCNRGVIDQSW